MTIFEKIVAGEIPAHKIYEDDKILAFLDIAPANTGHTLVIPKKCTEFVWDIESDDYLHMMKVVQKIAKHIRQKLNSQYVGMQVLGTDVSHAHVHIIPFNTTSEFYNENRQPVPNEELAQIAEKIKLN